MTLTDRRNQEIKTVGQSQPELANRGIDNLRRRVFAPNMTFESHLSLAMNAMVCCFVSFAIKVKYHDHYSR